MYDLHIMGEGREILAEEDEVIRKNCKQFREEAGWSLQDLANASGLSHSTVWRYEDGRSKPDRDAMRKLATAYGRSTEDFYNPNPPPPDPAKLPPVRRAFMITRPIDADLRRQLDEAIEKVNREAMDRE